MPPPRQPPNPPSRVTDRMVVVESIYYRPTNESPISADHSFSRILNTREVPSFIHQDLTERWIKADSLHLEDRVGLVWIRNRGDEPIEVLCLASRDVMPHVSEIVRPFLIPPGEAFPLTPSADGTVWLRCSKGTTRAFVVCFPE